MASPTLLTFDAEGRAVAFDVWLVDLQLFLQCDRRDGLSLFDLTSGASTAPAADADSTVRSHWLTRDAAARLAVRSHLLPTERAHFSQYKSAKTLYDAVVARYSSPATAALSRLMLPYLFPDLAAFATVTDLITHLRTSDTRYRAALPAEFCAQTPPPPMYITLYYLVTRLPDTLRSVRDHFLSLCPTTLTVDLLEERLLAAETSITAGGASRGDPRTPFFEGCSPVPLLPSVASAAAVDLVGTESTFTLPASPQQNGIAERRIGMVMDVTRTSMIHAAAPHFLWPFAVQYAAHQINLQPRVSLPETSPTLRWTGQVGDASAFRVWGSRAFVRDLSADKLSSRAVPCVFLGFPPDALGWQLYHPTSRRVLSSQDVTFDESGPAPSGKSQVDAVEPVEVAADSGASRSAEPECAESGGAANGRAESGGAGPGGAELGGAGSVGAESGGAEPERAEPGGAASGGAEPGAAESGGVEPTGTGPSGPFGALSRRELPSPQDLREWFARRWSRAAGAGGTASTGGSAAAGGSGAGGAAGAGTGGSASAGGAGATGPGGARTGGTGAAGPGGAPGAGATGVAGAGGAAGVGTRGGSGAGAAVSAGGPAGAGADAGGTGVVPAGSGGAARPRPYFVPLLEHVLGLPPSPSPAPSLECPPPVQSESQLQLVSPLPAPSPYAGPTRGLAERREPESRPASPVRPARTSRRIPRSRPPAVPGTHQMALRPSTVSQRVPLPSPPASSLPALADPASDSLRAASPTVTRLLATVVTDPSFESTAASALVTKLVDFAAHCHLDFAAILVAESSSVCPLTVGGECALSTDVLEDRQEEFQCFAAALPHLVSTLLAPEGDPDAPDIPTPRSYAEAIEGPYSSQWQAAMDAEMAS
ncbi:unnamed protein product [Closterium sp. NIES-54]